MSAVDPKVLLRGRTERGPWRGRVGPFPTPNLKQVWNIGANNSTFSGGLNLTAIDRYEVRFNASGSAGTGDVTVTGRGGDNRSAVLALYASDVFDDAATLTLNGFGAANSTGWTYANNIRIDMKTFNDTIGRLIIDGVEMPAGTYTGGSGDWIQGTGVLTVTSGGGATQPVLSGYGPLTGTSFPLTFSGTSGQSYEVLTSTNVALPLSSWTVLTSGTFGASPVIFTATGATNTQQFYCIKSP